MHALLGFSMQWCHTYAVVIKLFSRKQNTYTYKKLIPCFAPPPALPHNLPHPTGRLTPTAYLTPQVALPHNLPHPTAPLTLQPTSPHRPPYPTSRLTPQPALPHSLPYPHRRTYPTDSLPPPQATLPHSLSHSTSCLTPQPATSTVIMAFKTVTHHFSGQFFALRMCTMEIN